MSQHEQMQTDEMQWQTRLYEYRREQTLEWGLIAPYVKKFNEAQSLDQKVKILKELNSVIEKEHDRQFQNGQFTLNQEIRPILIRR